MGIKQGVLSNIKKTPRGVIFVVERVTMRACWENIEETPRRHCETLGSIEKNFWKHQAKLGKLWEMLDNVEKT